MEHEFKTPPIKTNPAGKERTVGFEIEFTGVEMEDVAAIISGLFGGTVKKSSGFEFSIKDTRFGDFGLELDAQLLREKKYEKFLKNIGIDLSAFEDQEGIEDSLKDLASSVVPYEIITPPIPLSNIPELTKLIDELRKMKAKGTGSSFVYAFGLHINPEIPDQSTESILNHLRAFVLLESWIRKKSEIDMSRRLTPYINKYEADYVKYILNPEYKPSQSELIRDYFKFGNTRNRPLDLQPLFMHLDHELTSTHIHDTLTNSRPTYHYRLPNCSLEDETWTLAAEWNRWVLVEKMADHQEDLKKFSRLYSRMRSDIVLRFETKWIEYINQWTQDVW